MCNLEEVYTIYLLCFEPSLQDDLGLDWLLSPQILIFLVLVPSSSLLKPTMDSGLLSFDF